MNNDIPAFPEPKLIYSDGMGVSQTIPGMWLRDYFATKAMHGIMTGSGYDLVAEPAEIATTAYEMADAMLAERAKAKP